MNKKSQVWVSVIIYTLVAVLALVLILNTGIPILTEMKDRSVFTKVKDIMLDLDSHITDIGQQGEGSQASAALEIRDGEIRFEDGQLVWELETKSEIISPRSSTTLGNLIISSNANVKTYLLDDAFLINTTIKEDDFGAKFKKIGSESNWQQYNTSEIIEYVSYNGNKMEGVFEFSLNNDGGSTKGTGYTKMVPSGNNTNLGRAKVIAHMNSTFAEYDIEFVLESYADFLTVRIKNFEAK